MSVTDEPVQRTEIDPPDDPMVREPPAAIVVVGRAVVGGRDVVDGDDGRRTAVVVGLGREVFRDGDDPLDVPESVEPLLEAPELLLDPLEPLLEPLALPPTEVPPLDAPGAIVEFGAEGSSGNCVSAIPGATVVVAPDRSGATVVETVVLEPSLAKSIDCVRTGLPPVDARADAPSTITAAAATDAIAVPAVRRLRARMNRGRKLSRSAAAAPGVVGLWGTARCSPARS